LTAGQRYLLQELKPFAAGLDEDDARQTDVSILQRAFGSHGLSPAVQTELRRVKIHKLTGEVLFTRLREIYDQHKMSPKQDHAQREKQISVPHIVCSEALRG